MKGVTSFKKVVVCHTNDFKAEINDRIKNWVEANGGAFSKDLTPAVTHLVASLKAWKRYHPLVKEARKMRTVRIVKYDWLEDSLMKNPVRALPVDDYLYEQTKLKPIKISKPRVKDDAAAALGPPARIFVPRERRIEATGMEFDKARQEFEQDMGVAGFHPYSDKTGFVYIVTLLRYDMSKKCFERYRLKVGHDAPSIPFDVVPGYHSRLDFFPAPWPFSSSPILTYHVTPGVRESFAAHNTKPWVQCLQLYESDEEPHVYACYMQYTRQALSKQVLVLAPPGSTWEFAWRMFERTFFRKVRTSWEKRSANGNEINLDGLGADKADPGEASAAKENAVDKRSYQPFQYLAPRIGEPEGVRPSNRVGAGIDRTTNAIIGASSQVEASEAGIRKDVTDQVFTRQVDIPNIEAECSSFDEASMQKDDSPKSLNDTRRARSNQEAQDKVDAKDEEAEPLDSEAEDEINDAHLPQAMTAEQAANSP